MLKLNVSKKANINYLAKVVHITEFSKHPNPEVTKMKVAHIGGYSISVGINEPEGFYVYFPTMSQIHSELLEYLNLYAKPEMNKDATAKPGFFGKNGRVKAIKLKGYPSEGFLLPYEHFNNWVVDSVNQSLPEPEDGLEFDEITNGNKSFWVCRKYIVRQQGGSHPYDRRSRYDKNLKKFDKIIENQFRFHYETEMLRKNPTVIKPNDIIQISSKWHGCVDADTIVEDSNGNFYTIKEVVDKKLDINIKAFDHTTNTVTYVPIDNYYTIPNDGDWYEIELENGKTIKITGNNPVFIPELNCYRKVEELRGDESLLLDF